MNGGHNKKSVRVEFVMSEAEAELVKERMAELGITNLSAYLRKMGIVSASSFIQTPVSWGVLSTPAVAPD